MGGPRTEGSLSDATRQGRSGRAGQAGTQGTEVGDHDGDQTENSLKLPVAVRLRRSMWSVSSVPLVQSVDDALAVRREICWSGSRKVRSIQYSVCIIPSLCCLSSGFRILLHFDQINDRRTGRCASQSHHHVLSSPLSIASCRQHNRASLPVFSLISA